MHRQVVWCALIMLALSQSTPAQADGTTTATAATATALAPDVTATLMPIRYKLEAVGEMLLEGEITISQRDAALHRYLKEARDAAGTTIPIEQLLTLHAPISETTAPQLTLLQKAAGFVTFMNILWVFAIVGGAVCAFILFGSLLLRVPAMLYELLAYGASAGLVAWGLRATSGTEYILLTGGALFAAALGITWKVHSDAIKRQFGEHVATAYFIILTITLGGIAMLGNSTFVGFAAMIALMGALGFSAAVIPCGYAVGFTDDDALARATSAGFLLLALFVGLRVFGISEGTLHVFTAGALWMGSFVGYLGLLIASSKWYSRRRIYPLMQLITILAGIAAIFFGSVFDVGELQKIGGTFFALYLIEKVCEIPAEGIEGKAFVGLLASATAWGVFWFATTHMDVLGPYLPF